MKKNIMVCVTQQKTSERLILKGHQLIDSKDDQLFVIHVVNQKEKFLQHSNDGEALEYLFGVSKNVGADLTVLRSKNVLKTMIDFSKENNITHIVIGNSPVRDKITHINLSIKLENSLPNVDFIKL